MGLLNVNDPVNEHLPFEVVHPAHPDSVIRVQHLASHTSGITDSDGYGLSYRLALGDSLNKVELGEYADEFNPDSAWTLSAYLQDYLTASGSIYSEDNFNQYAPGVRFDYSNIGASLAALVIESASGLPFSDFTEEHIFSPLEMNASTWEMDNVDLPSRTRNYGDEGLQLPYYRLITYPDGGLNCSSNELGIFLSELIKGYQGVGTLMGRDAYRSLFSHSLDSIQNPDQDIENPYNDEYNIGLFIGASGTGYWGHSGGDPGTGTLMFFDPETKRGQLIMVNSDMNNETYFEYRAIWDELCRFSGLAIRP